MSLTPSSIPLDLTGLTGAPPEEVYPLLERAALEQEPEALDALTALLLDRALRLLRQGSRQEIFEEAKALNRVLAGPECASLEETMPRIHGGWTALGELLSEASRRSDRAAVDSILLSTKGHGQSLLEELAREGGPVARAEIRKRLGLGESHLSHLLRDLAEADLIVRYRPEGSKEVLVELGPVGREVVESSLLPQWVEELIRLLDQPISNLEAVARQLREAGAPSALLADRLAAALTARPAIAEPPKLSESASQPLEETAPVIQELKDEEASEYYAKLGPYPDFRPLLLFRYHPVTEEKAA